MHTISQSNQLNTIAVIVSYIYVFWSDFSGASGPGNPSSPGNNQKNHLVCLSRQILTEIGEMACSIWCSRGQAHSEISWEHLYQLCRIILPQLLRISANRLTNDPLINIYIFRSSYLIHIFNVAVFWWFHKGSVRSGTIVFRGLQNIQCYMLEKLCYYRLGRLGNAGKHD